MTFTLYLLIGLAVGLTLGYLLAHFRAAAQLAQARAEAIRAQTQVEMLEAARTKLTDEFQRLSLQILGEQSDKFTQQQRTALSELLGPLDEKIKDFKQKVEHLHSEESQQRSALRQQVELLATQSQAVSQQTGQLATALRGDNKTLGNWGELTLERLLDASGLEKGRDYQTQVSATSEGGQRQQPDVLINLPDNRCVIIDAKTSLKDYLAHINAADEAARAAALKAHAAAFDTHINNLAKRRYQDLFPDRSPDFVLMFVPSEPALALALYARPALYETAAKANIILTGPGGLLATLRLVAQLWRQENQRQAITSIFDTIRKIYEKYVNFAEDMQQIDDALAKARNAYENAFKKLSTGDGNLLRQMENFRNQNIISPKKLPPPRFQVGGESEA
ncbi:MAG TPA: DNA recombination protein RmuC [Kiritimatiellia bacterium]|nr:DNA recombination protein RmuC [Kiritimatiellia bacterium]HOR73683.1 DNA recombination protein RmuC [Kiritimatiellia bacterium]HOU59409.1 DNA recombination protein RmuC [Kiritimatiellia bacterium]HPK68535.1 DNA recombination protein RmuC [Kiritimatiellia bacterium]HQK44808.1 DNA recombination protein RmuC [Kiritimatiellia bacterium]